MRNENKNRILIKYLEVPANISTILKENTPFTLNEPHPSQTIQTALVNITCVDGTIVTKHSNIWNIYKIPCKTDFPLYPSRVKINGEYHIYHKSIVFLADLEKHTTNNSNHFPGKKTSPVLSKSTLSTPKKLSKYDYTRYRCIRLLLDGSPLYYPRAAASNPWKTIGKEHLSSLWKDIKRTYIWKASLNQASLHLEDKNIVLFLEYKESVRYTTPPTKPIYTYMGYLKVLKYDLKADPVDCVNSALFNEGVILHDC